MQARANYVLEQQLTEPGSNSVQRAGRADTHTRNCKEAETAKGCGAGWSCPGSDTKKTDPTLKNKKKWVQIKHT